VDAQTCGLLADLTDMLRGRPGPAAARALQHATRRAWRAGVLGDQVRVTKDKTKVTVTSESEMSKRCARAAGLSATWKMRALLHLVRGAVIALPLLRPLRRPSGCVVTARRSCQRRGCGAPRLLSSV